MLSLLISMAFTFCLSDSVAYQPFCCSLHLEVINGRNTKLTGEEIATLCSAHLPCSQWMPQNGSDILLLYYLHYHVTKLVHIIPIHSDAWQYDTCIDKRVLRELCLQLKVWFIRKVWSSLQVSFKHARSLQPHKVMAWIISAWCFIPVSGGCWLA